MCLNREQTEQRMLQMSPNADMIWYIKRMGHLWANIHPPGPAMRIYGCIIDFPYRSGEWARKPGVCVLAPHPSHLSCWKHPCAQPPSTVSVLHEVWGPSSKMFSAAPFSKGICCERPTVAHPGEDVVSVPPRLVCWGVQMCCCCGAKFCPGSHRSDKTRDFFLLPFCKSSAKIWFKQLKILLTEISFSWRTFDLRDSSLHFQIHYPILNYGFYYKSLFLHSL